MIVETYTSFVISLNWRLDKIARYHTEVVSERKPILQERHRQTVMVNPLAQGGLFQHGQAARFALGRIFWVWSALVLSGVGVCEASVLNQTNFENGEKAPWKIFVTPNGTVGEAGWPTVVSFETAQEGQRSKSLKFKVGQVRYDPEKEPEQGGGLVVQITTERGIVHLSINVAVTYHSPKDKRNLAGGLFEWIVDDQLIASHDMGPIDNGGVLRYHLKAQHSVTAGVHTIRLRITRPFTSHPGQHAPFQFVDDLVIRHSPHQ